jgi:hypothetical protein
MSVFIARPCPGVTVLQVIDSSSSRGGGSHHWLMNELPDTAPVLQSLPAVWASAGPDDSAVAAWCCVLRSESLQPLTRSDCFSSLMGEGGLLHVDMFAHNKSGIAYRDGNRRSKTVVNHKREPHQQLRLLPSCTN